MNSFVIGIDYGTDSVRAILVDENTGKEIASSVSEYKRWKEGLFCSPEKNQFRQHPLDYIEGLESVINSLLLENPGVSKQIKAIAIDTTGSTPCLVDKNATPLALLDKYKDNPGAMFALWKDHTAVNEAEEINNLIAGWHIDYSKYSGGSYSSEWLWSKALHLLRQDDSLREDAYSIVEHCDWIPALLTGVKKTEDIMLARCSAGHKAMWASEWGGFPSVDFLSKLDNQLGQFVSRMNPETYTCDQSAGTLSEEWAQKLGLSQDVLVGIGNTDAHAGAVGAGVRYNTLVQNMGTSTCSMVVMPASEVGNSLVTGISGQVDGSIIPNMIGFEAGMSAFGDVYAWFKKLITASTSEIIEQSSVINDLQKKELIREISEKTLIQLTEKALRKINENPTVYATDWLNGRRNPFLNYNLKATITGLTLSSKAEDIYASLVEATVFGIKTIVDHFKANNVAIEEIVAIGGVPLKSAYVMQMLSDALNMPIRVPDCSQACALGAAMFASTLTGKYKDVTEAQERFSRPDLTTYHPCKVQTEKINKRYEMYLKLKQHTENQFKV